jgi:CheY-like chemotaxis protein
LKFTPEGKTVSVDVRVLDLRQGVCSVRFSVKDEGIGIPLSKQKLILEAFSQADTSVTRKFGGTGLGLAISNRLISRMGGQLTIESTPEQGSEFSFAIDLPLGRELHDERRTLPQVVVGVVKGEGAATATERLMVEYLEALGCRVEKVDLSSAKGHDIVFVVYGSVEERLISELAADETITLVVVAEPVERSRAESLSPRPAKLVYAPVYGSKLFDAMAELLFGDAEALEQEARVENTHDEEQAMARALVAEDNAVNQKLILYMLEQAGVAADVAGDGQEAVDLFSSGRYDIVFMDASMPILDGVQATRRILTIEREQEREHTPIVALTAHAIKGDRERFLEAGMDDYLPKPISLESLQSVLARNLASS